jgi:hypothetical protein
VILMFSMFIILIVWSFISFQWHERESSSKPRLTAVLIPSIELSCKIVFSCCVSIWFWINILSINFFIVELEFKVIKSKQYSLLYFFFFHFLNQSMHDSFITHKSLSEYCKELTIFGQRNFITFIDLLIMHQGFQCFVLEPI